MNPKLSIIKCSAYNPDLVFSSVRQAIDLIGGIEAYIKPNSSVLVKPNILLAKEPEYGITTHPEVVRAVIKILKGINCRVLIGDSPCVWGMYIENVDEVYRVSGIEKLCREEGAELVKFDKRRWRKKFPLTTWLDQCDYFVNVPKFKTHGLTLLTGAIKNLFGLVVGTYKTEMHKNYFEPAGFASALVDIYQEAPPSLTIVDGVVAMEGDGPGTSGKLRNQAVILASRDCVALDAVMAEIMGAKPDDVLTTKEAKMRGLGESDLKLISFAGERLEDVKTTPFLLPAQSMVKKVLPQPLVNLAKKLIKYYPCVERDHCIRCATCIKACPGKAISMKKKGIIFDYRKCIACFCCQETCPARAITIEKSLFARLIGL